MVEVTAPDGTKSVWAAAVAPSAAVEAVSRSITSPRSQTDGFRSAPRARGCAEARCGRSNHDPSKTPRDSNQLAKSIALEAISRLVELGLKAKPGKM
jgi:hypothetical protein